MAIKQETKDRGIRMGVNQLITYATLVPIFWFVIQPILVDALAEEMQESIKQTVAAEVAPLNGAFIALLQRDINVTKKEIAGLKFRQRRNDKWTSEDALSLADKEIELTALSEAKAALQRENT